MANGTIHFIFKVETEKIQDYRVDIMANNSCEAFIKCAERISDTLVNVLKIELVSRDDK